MNNRKTKLINGYLLWLSMCAVFPNQEKTKDLDWGGLLSVYLKKQIKRKRFNYVSFCRDNPKVARKTAKDVYLLRNPVHDFNYYEIKDV